MPPATRIQINGPEISDTDISAIKRVASAVLEGSTIVYPTATLYGIGGNAMDSRAAKKIRDIKKRPATSFILLAADAHSALSLGSDVPYEAFRLAEKLWPGPLTMVLPASDNIPVEVRAPDGTIAVRVDRHPFTRALTSACGCPIISTSANLSGRPPAKTAHQVDQAIIDLCDIFVIDDSPRTGQASTIVTFNNNVPVILRQGAITGNDF